MSFKRQLIFFVYLRTIIINVCVHVPVSKTKHNVYKSSMNTFYSCTYKMSLMSIKIMNEEISCIKLQKFSKCFFYILLILHKIC